MMESHTVLVLRLDGYEWSVLQVEQYLDCRCTLNIIDLVITL